MGVPRIRDYEIRPQAVVFFFLLTMSPLIGPESTICAWGATTEFWIAEGWEEYTAGTLEGTAVTSDGEITLAPEHETLANTDESYLWDLARDDEGSTYLATGSRGRILVFHPDSELTTLWESVEEMEIFSLAWLPEGGLYAGCTPSGLLLRVNTAGGADTVLDLEEEYIWDLVPSPGGDLYLAVGQPARIYRWGRRDPEPELFFEVEDEHFLSLSWHPDGHLLAGTGGEAVVYAIGTDGEGRILYDARQTEIRALLTDREGNVLVAATGNEKEEGDTTGPGPGVYRINVDGTVQKIWRCPEEVLYSMAQDAEGTLFVGTGNGGKLFTLPQDRTQPASLVATVAQSQVIALLGTGEGVLAGTGNPAVLHLLAPEPVERGEFTSRAFDAGQVCRWGTLAWDGDIPRGTAVSMECRSGNTEEPRPGWSPWTRIEAKQRSGALECPPGRYIQWRAGLSSSRGESPRLVRVRVSYLPPNLPPRIYRLSISAHDASLTGAPPGSPTPQLHQVLPSGVEVTFSARQPTGLPPDEVAPWARALRTADWEAADPNEDPLLYELHYRAADEREWKLLQDELEGTAYAWNTASFPDGLYQLRLVASDRRGNPAGAELTAEKLGTYFLVDNTPPEISHLRVRRLENGDLRVEAAAADRGGTLRRARYAVDGGDWQVASAADGMMDESEEEFLFHLPGYGPAEHTVVLKVVDEAGNVTTRRALVTP